MREKMPRRACKFQAWTTGWVAVPFSETDGGLGVEGQAQAFGCETLVRNLKGRERSINSHFISVVMRRRKRKQQF
jgi:hypothetical protein